MRRTREDRVAQLDLLAAEAADAAEAEAADATDAADAADAAYAADAADAAATDLKSGLCASELKSGALRMKTG